MDSKIVRKVGNSGDPIREITPVAGKIQLAALDSNQFKAEVGKSRVIEAVNEHLKDLGVDLASIHFGLDFVLDW